MVEKSEMQGAERMIQDALAQGATFAMDAIPREYATATEPKRAAIVAALIGRVCVTEAIRGLGRHKSV